MGFPIKKQAAANANDLHNDGDRCSGLDLLSAVIDSRIVQSSHGSNTYSKKGLIESPTYLGKSLFELEGPVQRFIPAAIFDRMVGALLPV
jgi:hypothetical protein